MKVTFSLLVFCAALPSNAAVLLERIPAGGLQPQVVSSADGTLHLVSLVGDPLRKGDKRGFLRGTSPRR